MVYEHIRHIYDIDEHVSTAAICPDCHKNSIMSSRDSIIPTGTSLVSHYGSTRNLVNTSDCMYCHYDEDNAEEWGDAPDPRNHTHYTFVEKTLVAGRPWWLVDNYSITLIETTRTVAMFAFEKDGVPLEYEFVSEGEELEFEISGIETENTTIVNLTIDRIFTSEDNYVAEVAGYVLASRIHRETDNKACYACHDREYRTNLPDGRDYYVLDKDDENVTLGLMLYNFKEDDKKLLLVGEYWDLGDGYRFHVADVSLTGASAAYLQLYRMERSQYGKLRHRW